MQDGTESLESGDGWVKDSGLWDLSGYDPLRYILLLKQRGLVGPSQSWRPRRLARRLVQHPM